MKHACILFLGLVVFPSLTLAEVESEKARKLSSPQDESAFFEDRDSVNSRDKYESDGSQRNELSQPPRGKLRDGASESERAAEATSIGRNGASNAGAGSPSASRGPGASNAQTTNR